MRTSQSLARIYETYTEEELRNAKDEPDSDVVERFTGRAALAILFADDPQGANATRRRVKRSFEAAGHTMAAADALASARRVLGLDTPREV